MDLETREYKNGDISFVKTVEGKYQLEVFLPPSKYNPGHYTPDEMRLTVYGLPGLPEVKSHMVGGFTIEGNTIIGYGGNEHDKLVVEDSEIITRVKFLMNPTLSSE